MTYSLRFLHIVAVAGLTLVFSASGARAADIHDMIRASILGVISGKPLPAGGDVAPVDMQVLAQRSILGIRDGRAAPVLIDVPQPYDAHETARRQILGHH